MAENYKHLYQQMKKMVEMYQDEVVPRMRKTIEEQEAIIEDLREGFVDYVCGGARDPADYCKNKREECVNSIGWCIYGNKCRGFNPLGERRDGE